jgi:hypothetical protein
MKSVTIKPKMKENKEIERIIVEMAFNEEGQDSIEKYLVTYRDFPGCYSVYPMSNKTDIAKGEIGKFIKYYISSSTNNNGYKDMIITRSKCKEI